MIKVDYPKFNFKIKTEAGKEIIFDEIRKQWVILTPEEWVRQNTIQYLLQSLHYPASLIAVEKALKLGELKKRFDILVYNQEHQPWLMIECKATDVPLTESVLQQVLRYNMAIPVTYLIITNGESIFGWHVTDNCNMLEAFPSF
jgi:hypothetical protein